MIAQVYSLQEGSTIDPDALSQNLQQDAGMPNIVRRVSLVTEQVPGSTNASSSSGSSGSTISISLFDVNSPYFVTVIVLVLVIIIVILCCVFVACAHHSANAGCTRTNARMDVTKSQHELFSGVNLAVPSAPPSQLAPFYYVDSKQI